MTRVASVVVFGTDATMVYDTLHNVIIDVLGDLDPAIAQQDFTARDVTAGAEPVGARALEALRTPGFLVDRRVVVVRDAQLLVADEVGPLADWMASPSGESTLVLAVVGTKAHRLVKAAQRVVEVNVGSGRADRTTFVAEKMAQYHVTMDRETVQRVAERIGDDVARVDALARTLASIYGTSPLGFGHVEPYLGDAGDVPEWDLTDAIDEGDAAAAITVARRMLDSRGRVALQIVNMLQRHVLRMVRLEGSGARNDVEAAALLGVKPFQAGKALRAAQRLGAARLQTAVHWITEADVALKGGVSYGGRDLTSDTDVTDLTVIEVLVARLAKLTQGARRR